LSNEKKEEPTVTLQQPEPQAVEVIAPESGEMSAEEFRLMVERARNAGPEDCEMCGS
jgi:ribonucleoside-diphosphate reductase alpha chain